MKKAARPSTLQAMPPRRSLLAAMLAAGALFAGLAPAHAQTEIKLGHVGEPGSLFQLSADEFARRANARLGGKAKVVVFGSSQLGGDKEMLQKLKLGTIDMALPSTVMTSEVDTFGIFEMPYIVKDRNHMAKIEKEIFWPSIAPAAEKKGLKVLAVWENGYRHITSNKQPVKAPADLKGIKLRVPEGKWRVRMFQPDEVFRAVYRLADRRDGWRGKPADANLFGQAAGSAEVPVDVRPCVHAGLPDRGHAPL
jgi:TRAP-type C4-dicarboxylate transport system substrate-binding protein